MKHRILQNKFYLLVSVLLMTACTQDELAEQGTSLPEGVFPLEIASVTLDVEGSAQPWGADAPQTRVSENGTGSGSVWNDGDQITVQIGNGEPGIYTMDGNGSLTAETPAYWESSDDNQTITAWYSEGESIDLADQSNGLAYVLQATATANFNQAVSFSFKHSLSKIRVKLKGEKADDVHTVQVKSYTQCTHNKGTVSGSDENWITMKECTYEGEKCWEANVVPEFEIKEIQLNGNTPCTFTSFKSEVGKIHEITINVKQATLKPIDGKFTVNGGDVLIKDYEGTAPIVVNGDATITLDNVKLTTEGTAMEINNGATVTLKVEGTNNSLTSTNGSGIGAHENCNITIQGDGTGYSKLTVSAGEGRNVGIGFITNTGGGTFNYGDIEISDVTLSVEGSDSGAAIGTTGAVNTYSNRLVCGDITINNANVTANSKNANACIGTSSWSVNQSLTWNVISITNSTITAKSEGNGYGDYAACIGMGYVGLGSVTIKKIEINNSTLNLSTDASYKVGKGTIKGGTVSITDGIIVNREWKGNEGWNP